MDSENINDLYEDNRDVDLSRQSLRSTKRSSRASSTQKQKHNKNFRDKIQEEDVKEGCVESRSKTKIWRPDPDPDPDRDHVSDGDGQRSGDSFYSEDYENESASERSLSPNSRSRTPSPTQERGVCAKRISSSPFYKIGDMRRQGMCRPLRPGGQPQQHRKGVRSQTKESTPPKDLDLVTKRMLSVRLLKINELRNTLAELQLRIDELQKENRTLRQLQVRQEKALHRFQDTESEISHLLSCHSNETHVLRERLRRTKDRERAALRRLKESEEQLQMNQATISRMRKLVNQRELGSRDELRRKLDEERARAQEAECKIKELERCMELSSSSYQRQLAAERKKKIIAQEETRTLQEELERLTNKLKEKEKELDARNIYANRMGKASMRKDMDGSTKRRLASRNSTKAVQTEDRPGSLDFPTPPPAITDANEYGEQAPEGYLSLKELDRGERPAEMDGKHQTRLQQMRQKEKGSEKDFGKEKKQEKQQLKQELGVLEEKTKRAKDDSEKQKEEEDGSSSLNQRKKEEEYNRKRGHVQEEVERWNQEAVASQRAEEETRRKKEQLLAKMREIDGQNQGAQNPLFAEPDPSESDKGASDNSSPRLPEQKNQNASVFNPTEVETAATLGRKDSGRRRPGVEGGALSAGMGRRAARSQISGDDLAFGSYAPSFGHSTSRCSSSFPPPPPKEDKESALEAIGVFSLKGLETDKDKGDDRQAGKDQKSSLMQQLFGTMATPAGDSTGAPSKMEVLSNPANANGVRSRREGLLGLASGSFSSSVSSLNTFHVTESRPAVRAMASFDDDIEELTL